MVELELLPSTTGHLQFVFCLAVCFPPPLPEKETHPGLPFNLHRPQIRRFVHKMKIRPDNIGHVKYKIGRFIKNLHAFLEFIN